MAWSFADLRVSFVSFSESASALASRCCIFNLLRRGSLEVLVMDSSRRTLVKLMSQFGLWICLRAKPPNSGHGCELGLQMSHRPSGSQVTPIVSPQKHRLIDKCRTHLRHHTLLNVDGEPTKRHTKRPRPGWEHDFDMIHLHFFHPDVRQLEPLKESRCHTEIVHRKSCIWVCLSLHSFQEISNATVTFWKSRIVLPESHTRTGGLNFLR